MTDLNRFVIETLVPAIKERKEIDQPDVKLTFKTNAGNIRSLKFLYDEIWYYFECFSEPIGMYMLEKRYQESHSSIFHLNWQTEVVRYGRYFSCFKESKCVYTKSNTTTTFYTTSDVLSWSELPYKAKNILQRIVVAFYRTELELVERYFFQNHKSRIAGLKDEHQSKANDGSFLHVVIPKVEVSSKRSSWWQSTLHLKEFEFIDK